MKPTPWTICPEVLPWRPSFAVRTKYLRNTSDKRLEAHRIVAAAAHGVKVANGQHDVGFGIALSRMPPGYVGPIVIAGLTAVKIEYAR